VLNWFTFLGFFVGCFVFLLVEFVLFTGQGLNRQSGFLILVIGSGRETELVPLNQRGDIRGSKQCRGGWLVFFLVRIPGCCVFLVCFHAWLFCGFYVGVRVPELVGAP